MSTLTAKSFLSLKIFGLSQKSIGGKMLSGLACVAALTALVAVARPFEPEAVMAAKPAQPVQIAANVDR
jgi:hypothetical protein